MKTEILKACREVSFHGMVNLDELQDALQCDWNVLKTELKKMNGKSILLRLGTEPSKLWIVVNEDRCNWLTILQN